MRPSDPRVRQSINRISQNIESANETVQESVYTFSQKYLSPCLGAIGNCIRACTAPCFPSREDQLRRRRRGRAEFNFDFYDDWDNDDAGDGLLGWGNDELDRLLAGSGISRRSADQPRRQRTMSYGTRSRRRSSVLQDERNDPLVIPSSSFLGFLERFPWRIGARGIKYRPSAADLQENPGGVKRLAPENEPLMEAAEESDRSSDGKNGRGRSGTQSSRDTENSLSSRGDLIPSDEEEDAVPLSDEFALALGRRGTGFSSESQLGGRSSMSQRSTSGTASLGTTSSRESKGKSKRESKERSSLGSDVEVISTDVPSMADLQKEEERVRLEEEAEIARKRLAAHKLAVSRGLEPEDDLTTSSRPTSQPAPGATSQPEADCQAAPEPAQGERSPTSRVHRLSQLSDWRRPSSLEPFPPLSPDPPTGMYATDASAQTASVVHSHVPQDGNEETKPVDQNPESDPPLDEG